jgi:transcriptional regulator with XRE-family HTH domain
MTAPPEFADLFASLLRRRGTNLAELAPIVGVSASTLSRIRTGRRAATEPQARRLAKALGLADDEAEHFIAAALLQAMPPAVRERLRAAEDLAGVAQARTKAIERGFAQLRSDTGFHDGWWISWSRSFFNDGRIQRSLLRLEGGGARLLAGEHGLVRYSYHGTCETLGDKLFIRVAEDRGTAEWVQITCHSLFDLSRPSFLYGLVSGISGTDVRHPVSWPSAARILLLHACPLADADERSERARQLESLIGAFDPSRLRGAWPAFLGSDDHIRAALQLGDEPIEQAIVRLTDNGLGEDGVLRAALG